jgi:DNA repair photolyase
MVREITAKTILSRGSHGPDPWFGVLFSMNLYRGCQHRCIYCDSRSECYGIDTFDTDVLVKANAIELLRAELGRKRVKSTIGTGAMNDPYMPLEKTVNLTGQALAVIAEFAFPVHVTTKSDLVVRDIDLLKRIGRVYAAVSFTVTTADDSLARDLEPGAPAPSERFRAMKALAAAGIYTGVTLMPVLPFIEDTAENVRAIVAAAADSGASYVIPCFGMTLRDRQRAYYYDQLDRLFPEVRQKYEARFGDRYEAVSGRARELGDVFERECAARGIATKMRVYDSQRVEQTALW